MVSDRPTCRPTGMRHWISAPDKSRLTRFHKQVLVPPLWRKIKCFAAHGKLFLSVFACFPIFQSGCLLFPFWASEKKTSVQHNSSDKTTTMRTNVWMRHFKKIHFYTLTFTVDEDYDLFTQMKLNMSQGTDFVIHEKRQYGALWFPSETNEDAFRTFF